MPRRLTREDEDELLQVAGRIEQSERDHRLLLAERDQLIARLLEQGRRTTDIADVLGMSRAWVAAARDRARETRPATDET
jgi:DNA-binding NarL/FixJ family response regulator